MPASPHPSPAPAEPTPLPTPSPDPTPQAAHIVSPPRRGQTRPSPKDVKAFDFRRPAFLSPRELRKLRQRHEEFASALSARLSIYLRLEFSLQISDLQPLSYAAFTDSLPDRTHLCLFKLEPLRGIGILELHPRLGLTIIDRLLGGPAQPFNPERDFSEIELALLNQALLIVLSEWSSLWNEILSLQPSLLGHETNARFLQVAPHDTPMLVLSMEARLGECLEQIQLALPGYTLEPLLSKLGASIEPEASPEPAAAPAAARWNHQYDDLKIPLTASWLDLELTAGELARLQAGDFLELDPHCAQRVSIRISGQPRFAGRLGSVNGRWAVEVQEALKP